MEQFIPQLLGVILVLALATIIAVVLIAIIRPGQLPVIAALIRAIVLALLRRDVEIQVTISRKLKNDDHH